MVGEDTGILAVEAMIVIAVEEKKKKKYSKIAIAVLVVLAAVVRIGTSNRL